VSKKGEVMIPSFNWTFFICGCVGGLFPDILRIIQNRYNKLPEYLCSGNFWLGLFLLVLLGGVASWISGASQVKEALLIGFTAPEVISKVLSEPKSGPPATKGAGRRTLRSWWAA
jgi:hypothetical protein